MFETIVNAFLSGGIWMWVILCLQLVAVAIIIERALYLFRNRKVNQLSFAKNYEEAIRQGDLKAVISKAEKDSETFPIAKAIRAGALAASNMGGKDEIQGKMDEVLLSENAKLEKRTPFLSMLANVGTLTGLLGTIVGMIKAFTAITNSNPMEKATLLSNGISEAMNTTAYGLIMAIPTLIMFAVLTNRSTQLIEDMNQAGLKVFNWLSFAYEPVFIKEQKRQNTTRQLDL